MKGPQSFSQALTIVVALSPLASAWPKWLPDIDALIVRRDGATTTSTSGPTATSTNAKGTTTSVVSAKSTNNAQTTNLNTGGQVTSTGSATGSKATSGSVAASHTTYDPQSPAGGIAMLTPATTSGTQLYKIGGTPITWVWNYTSLLGSPTALDVMVSCSAATETWTLTQNMSFVPTGTFTWDTSKYQTAVQSPLLTEQYTLVIIDADSSVSATAEAGYLAPFDGFTFGMYAPQPYSNLSEWKCATCSAGNGDLDRHAMGFMLTMCAVTVLSFTWYVTGLDGLL